jgi:hypothetical protein
VTGTFDGDVTNTSDIFGNDTEEILVTQDVSGTVGTAAGDTPAVGSIYNVFYDDGDKSDYNLYSVTPSSSGDVILDTWVSPTGDTTYRDSLGGSSEAILVTGDSGTTGTAAGDLPPVGSEFDIVNDGGGYETVYSDLASTTART